MAKRMLGCDVLGEVRRSMRILRRVERWLMQQERDLKRKAAKDRERFEAKAKERVERTVKSARKAFNVPDDAEAKAKERARLHAEFDVPDPELGGIGAIMDNVFKKK